MKITSLAEKTTPLCFMPNGELVCYCKGVIIIFDDGVERKRIPLHMSHSKDILSNSKLLFRLLRLGVRSAIAIDDSNIAISIGNEIRELNVNTEKLSDGYVCAEGVRPLIFSSVKAIKGFEDGIFFGGYVRNSGMNSVSVYRRTDEDEWDVVYTFPEGVINHVHNIIADPYRHCLWILTGDFGDAAAIWRAYNGFNNVERFAAGNQKWRGCVAFAVPEGLLYATDSPFTQNYVYLLEENGTSTIICSLSGSCIYGCEWKSKYVFSTVVEPDGRNETMLKLLFERKRGSGIVDNYARIYYGDARDGFTEIYRECKDIWPFLFQFGSFRFPSGKDMKDVLYFQSIATKDNDLSLMTLEIK